MIRRLGISVVVGFLAVASAAAQDKQLPSPRLPIDVERLLELSPVIIKPGPNDVAPARANEPVREPKVPTLQSLEDLVLTSGTVIKLGPNERTSIVRGVVGGPVKD